MIYVCGVILGQLLALIMLSKYGDVADDNNNDYFRKFYYPKKV